MAFPDDLPKYPYAKALYRKNNFNQPCVWHAQVHSASTIEIFHGILGKSIIHDIVSTNRKPADEVKSRINAKRKVGYKYLSELKDNNTLPVEGELLNYLNTYLPKIRTTIDDTVLPMLAKVYNANNAFKKCDCYIGQYKINGLRCFISVERTNTIYFEYRLRFQSREGIYWNTLGNLEKYLLSVLDPALIKRMYEEHWVLDGEVYLPGYSVNEINHFIKDGFCYQNSLLQFWCYDMAIQDCIQSKRIDILHNYLNKFKKDFVIKEDHLNNKDRLVLLPHTNIYNNEIATFNRNKFISLGFEGLIMRNPNAEYQYGARNMSMVKYKSTTDGKFIIIDIYPEGIKRNNIPLFKLKNDINDSTFEVHVNGSHEYQESILRNKEQYIGKLMFVSYGERSGVNKVPFHCKEVHIIDK